MNHSQIQYSATGEIVWIPFFAFACNVTHVERTVCAKYYTWRFLRQSFTRSRSGVSRISDFSAWLYWKILREYKRRQTTLRKKITLKRLLRWPELGQWLPGLIHPKNEVAVWRWFWRWALQRRLHWVRCFWILLEPKDEFITSFCLRLSLCASL